MTFRLELRDEDALPAVLRSPDFEVPRDGLLSAHDELVHVLAAQCRALARTGGVSFEVGGFGQDRWPVDDSSMLDVGERANEREELFVQNAARTQLAP